MVKYFYSKSEMHHVLKFVLFCSSTLHVSNVLSVHHQESVHTASGMCQTESVDCLLAETIWKQSAESVGHILDAVGTVLDS
jgi:hypothetical protein